MAYKYLSGGGTSVCGITAGDSTLHCWDISTSGRAAPIRNEPDGAFRSVGLSYHEVMCGLRVEGTVECPWGQLGGANQNDADAAHVESQFTTQTRQNIAALNDAPDEDTLGYTMVAMDRTSFACDLRTDHSIACW